MAVLFIDGFDHYTTADILKKWSSLVASTYLVNPPSIVSNGVNGGKALGNLVTMVKYLPSNHNTLIVGCALCVEGPIPIDYKSVLAFMDNGTTQISLSIDITYHIVIRAGDTLHGQILGRSINPISPIGWSYVELKVLFDTLVGTVTARINEVECLSLVNQNTSPSTNPSANGLMLGGINYTLVAPNYVYTPDMVLTTAKIDNLYLSDTSGPAPTNDFLGVCNISVQVPVADGAHLQLTPSSGTAHFPLVAELFPDNATHNSSATSGDIDSYKLSSVIPQLIQTVFAVQVNAAASTDGIGPTQLSTLVHSGGVDALGPSTIVGPNQQYVSYIGDIIAGHVLIANPDQQYVSQVFNTDPSKNVRWTTSSVNVMEAGVKIV